MFLLASFQFKAPSTLCRAAASECDLPEFCHGNTEWCPRDVHKQNGITCDNEEVSFLSVLMTHWFGRVTRLTRRPFSRRPTARLPLDVRVVGRGVPSEQVWMGPMGPYVTYDLPMTSWVVVTCVTGRTDRHDWKHHISANCMSVCQSMTLCTDLLLEYNAMSLSMT